MALAYSTFAGQGRRPKQLFLITKIEDHTGRVIYASQAADADPAPGDRRIHCLSSPQLPAPGASPKARAPPLPPNTGSAKSPPPESQALTPISPTSGSSAIPSRMTCAILGGLDKPGMIFENAFSNRLALPVWATVIKAAETGYPERSTPAAARRRRTRSLHPLGPPRHRPLLRPRPDPRTGMPPLGTGHLPRTRPRPGYRAADFCNFPHSDRPTTAADVAEVPLTAEPTLIADPKVAAIAATTDAVAVIAPVVLGDIDPYQAVKSSVRVPKAQPVGDSEATPAKQPSFDLTPRRLLENEKGRLDLKPPEPVRIN